MIDEVRIRIKRINKNFNDIPLPSYSTEGSSGMDIRAAVDDFVLLKEKEIALVPTNLSVEIPEGYELQVRPRSGLSVKHGIGILNSPGTIDSDYRGEIKIILFNFGSGDFRINRGDRIAQIVLNRFYKAVLDETAELNNSSRGSGGFGHTGKE